MSFNNNKKIRRRLGIDHEWRSTMAPNLALLTLSPEINGLPEPAKKITRLHRLYDFIVRSQSRRAEREVARYLQRTRPVFATLTRT